MLKVKNVSKIYKKGKKEALKEVSLEVDKGEFVALLGPNGAGKSTLINILAGNTIKTEGKVFISGLDIDKEEIETKRILGVVPQEIAIDHFFTVKELLKNQLGYFGIKNNMKYIEEVLKELSLLENINKYPRMLSGGMKRRLLIAKALIHKPKLLILDEPTAGVDIELRKQLFVFLRKMHKLGVTILLTTHYLDEAEELCDRIVIIDKGKILADQNKKELIDNLGSGTLIEFSFDRKIKKQDFEFLNEFDFEITENKLQISTSKRELANVFEKICNKKLKYLSFSIKQEDLEDVFLKIIKENGDENN